MNYFTEFRFNKNRNRSFCLVQNVYIIVHSFQRRGPCKASELIRLCSYYKHQPQLFVILKNSACRKIQAIDSSILAYVYIHKLSFVDLDAGAYSHRRIIADIYFIICKQIISAGTKLFHYIGSLSRRLRRRKDKALGIYVEIRKSGRNASPSLSPCLVRQNSIPEIIS